MAISTQQPAAIATQKSEMDPLAVAGSRSAPLSTAPGPTDTGPTIGAMTAIPSPLTWPISSPSVV